MNDIDRKRKYKEATNLLNRAIKLLDEAFIAHSSELGNQDFGCNPCSEILLPSVERDYTGMIMDNVEKEINKLNEVVDEFAEVMKIKLSAKAKEGYKGWNERSYEGMIISRLISKCNLVEFDRQQAVDIANLAMMLWYPYMIMQRNGGLK